MKWVQMDVIETDVRKITYGGLGAITHDNGCYFSILKSTDYPLELVLFDDDNHQYVYPLSLCAFQRFGTYINGVKAGTRYSYRGKKDNHLIWILDPYAKSLCAHPYSDDIPCAKVINASNITEAPSPKVPNIKTIIYELHVKGFTQLNALIPDELRGKFLGLCHKECIKHFKEAGITTLQLMPIMASIDELHLAEKKLTNYWGYNSISWFAPNPKFAINDALSEFKKMVSTLHEHGIEVILDVVFNHTSESGDIGFYHHFKYLLPEMYLTYKGTNQTGHFNYTGCGNTVDMRNNHALRIVMDSLRYWVSECHVDGFRFDLAATLGRDGKHFNKNSSFFKAIQQDPILSKVKLIAEPWDIGPDGYQLGHFPVNWQECNDKYRDTCRNFWNHNEPIGQLASQLMGFRDVFSAKTWPYKFSVNYISYHDGFTLEDLVSYNKKHNQDNGENNQDGHSYNCSFNHGVEGKTQNPQIVLARQQQKRNLVTTLLFSFGIPHLLAADTFSHTQQGNNNAYCQDNEISWINWEEQDPIFSQWLKNMIHLRQKYMTQILAVFTGEQRYHHKIQWLKPNGEQPTYENWDNQTPIELYIAIEKQKPALLYLINRSENDMNFVLPTDTEWEMICDTSQASISSKMVEKKYLAQSNSIVILWQGEQ